MKTTGRSVIVFLVAIFAIGAQAADFSQFKPCQSGFYLKVLLQPVNSVGGEETGFEVESKNSQTAILQIQSTQIHSLPKKVLLRNLSCAEWEKKNWATLQTALKQNHSSDRASLQCLDVASIEVHQGKTVQKENICLGLASKDAVSSNFKQFYQSTEALLSIGDQK